MESVHMESVHVESVHVESVHGTIHIGSTRAVYKGKFCTDNNCEVEILYSSADCMTKSHCTMPHITTMAGLCTHENVFLR